LMWFGIRAGRSPRFSGRGRSPSILGKSPKADATRVLLAAFGIQASAAALNATPGRRHDPIVVNIGINVGTALVGITRLRGRTGEHQVFSASGPVTNVEARICALATHGQILVTGIVAGCSGTPSLLGASAGAGSRTSAPWSRCSTSGAPDTSARLNLSQGS
jgi:class 3 adenylate cyclase